MNFNSTHIFFWGAVPFQAVWDLSSPTRAQTCAPPAVEDRQGSPSRHILMECLQASDLC